MKRSCCVLVFRSAVPRTSRTTLMMTSRCQVTGSNVLDLISRKKPAHDEKFISCILIGAASALEVTWRLIVTRRRRRSMNSSRSSFRLKASSNGFERLSLLLWKLLSADLSIGADFILSKNESREYWLDFEVSFHFQTAAQSHSVDVLGRNARLLLAPVSRFVLAGRRSCASTRPTLSTRKKDSETADQTETVVEHSR